MTHKKKWLLFAPAGLILVGGGACLVQWAAGKKERGASAGEWIAAGTLALGVLNVGVSLVGRSVIENVLYELREKGTEPEFDYSNVARF